MANFKVKVRNLSNTNDYKIALMNPEQLELNLEAITEKHTAMASSLTNLEYVNTSPLVFSIDFFISLQELRKTSQNPEKDLQDWIRFFAAGVYPPELNVFNNISLNPYLFIWENVITMRCNITNVSLPITKFDKNGNPLFVFITVTFHEIPDGNIKTFESIRNYGFNRQQ